jgi:tetratricopeptide (TPR) repeat protein
VAAARAEGEGVYRSLDPKDNERILLKNAAAYEGRFQDRGYVYEDKDLDEMVGRLGRSLAPAPTDDYLRYRFHVLRDAEPGAFTLPDGQIYVNTGLLAVLDNEAQIAGVLAHEIQHAAGHHGILSYRSARRKLITSMALGPFTLGVGDYFLMRSIMGYSRDLEEEADRRAATRLVRAGFDPSEMPRLFEILLRDPEGERPERPRSKWSSHPELEARIAYTREMLPGLLAGRDPGSLQVNAQGYRRRVVRASLDTVTDLVDADYPRSALSLARRLVGENPRNAAPRRALADAYLALGSRASLEGEEAPTNKEKVRALRARAWYTRSEREGQRLETPDGRATQKANLEKARQAYLEALAIDPDCAEAHRGLGYVYTNLSRPKDGGREFVAYLKARPDAPDRRAILNELEAINDSIRQGGSR